MNGYTYNGAYDGNAMDQGEQGGGEDMMMMGQDGMNAGMMGGQSLDEIVNQNAKAMRRQSMPHQYGGAPQHMEDMRRMTMMEYGSGSPAAHMNNFQYNASPAMDHSAMMAGSGTPGHGQQQRSQSRRQSQTNLGLNTNFGNTSPNFNGVMSGNAPFQASPHPQSGFDMTMESPYMDPGMGMQMDYNVDHNLGNAAGGEMSRMNMFSQPQFNQSMVPSPHAAQTQSHDQTGSGMNTQYSNHTNGSGHTARHMSRSQSLHVQSPAHSGGVTPMSQSQSAMNQNNTHGGFQAQPQHPQPGSRHDVGMHNSQPTYDGVNGPIQVNVSKHNPNSQNFNWEAPEGDRPSTMINRPHMQTSYKNAYSSTGFDMLGVLVRVLRSMI